MSWAKTEGVFIAAVLSELNKRNVVTSAVEVVTGVTLLFSREGERKVNLEVINTVEDSC